MGSDLFNACVFCAATLFHLDFAPPNGYSGEVVAGYTTLQRQLEAGGTATQDRSDVTGKFAAVGLHWTRPAEGDLGAGTPASEVRLRFAFPTSHDEASQSPQSPIQLVATGNGRYENFLGVFRVRVDASDSVEFGIEQRRNKITDLLNISSSPLQFTHERDLIAEHIYLGLGWRHRWSNFELAGAVTGSHFEGKTDTPPSGILGAGTIPGGMIDLRGRKGPWTLSLLVQAVSGNLTVSERYGPTAQIEYTRPAWIEALTISLQRRVKKFDFLLSAQLDRSRLPFVSLAVLGTEQLAFDSGYHPDSRTNQWLFDVAVRYEVVPGIFPRFYFRYAHGSETVALADTLGILQPRTLTLIRGGQLTGSNPTAPEYSIGIALEGVFGH